MPTPITTSHVKSRPIAWSGAMLAASLFAACLGLGEDDGLKTVDVRYTGALSTLDSAVVSQGGAMRWHLAVDAAEPRRLRGECHYDAWLGDSAGVEADSTTLLYTNTQMKGVTQLAETIRQEGIDFYLYPEHDSGLVLTHYRVDFKCSY